MPLYPNFSLHNSLTTLPYPPFSPHSPHSQYALHTCHFLYSTPFLLSTTLFTLFISSFLTLLVWRVEDGELSLNAVKECLSLFSIICAKIHFRAQDGGGHTLAPCHPITGQAQYHPGHRHALGRHGHRGGREDQAPLHRNMSRDEVATESDCH